MAAKITLDTDRRQQHWQDRWVLHSATILVSTLVVFACLGLAAFRTLDGSSAVNWYQSTAKAVIKEEVKLEVASLTNKRL